MAVAFDAVTESIRTATTDPYTFTHTPVGTPRGIVVFVIHGVQVIPHVTGVTYGGVYMQHRTFAGDSVTEPGNVTSWWLGANIPTGAQTVSVDLSSGTGDDIAVYCFSITAATDTEVVDSGAVNENAANPSVTLRAFGRTCIAFAGLYGGGSDGSVFTENANCTTRGDHDFGNFYAEVMSQTTPSTSDFAIGGTAVSDDVAFAALNMSEVAGAGRMSLSRGCWGSL